MLFLHENLCTDIKYHDVHQKNYVNFFNYFKIYFLIILYNKSICSYQPKRRLPNKALIVSHWTVRPTLHRCHLCCIGRHALLTNNVNQILERRVRKSTLGLFGDVSCALAMFYCKPICYLRTPRHIFELRMQTQYSLPPQGCRSTRQAEGH
jgi:hypothetical protein